jgi:sec-independent protein translocase protein TatC
LAETPAPEPAGVKDDDARQKPKSGGAEMSLIEHLEELRERLIKSSLAIIIATFISLAFTNQLLKILIAPLGGIKPQILHPTEGIVMYFKVALIGGLILSMPVIVYQVVRFVVPGLTSAERRYLYVLIPGATILFAAGVAFASFVMLPFALPFLQGFGSEFATPGYTLDYYISFVTTFVFWIGIVFETPLVVATLARLGIVSPQQLSTFRKYSIIINAIISAVVTPTPDPFNMLLVMAPLTILYEVGVLLARLVYRPRDVSFYSSPSTQRRGEQGG